MAPTLSSRQFNGDGPGDFGDRDRDNNNGISTWAIVAIAIAVALVALILVFVIFRRMRRRNKAVRSTINLTSRPPNNQASTSAAASSDPSKYTGGAGGYAATADQNHSLLGNAEAPAIVTWDASANDHTTQDGFGYDNNLHLAPAGIQRPPSVASAFAAPPPRYEEATNTGSSVSSNTAGGLRPQGGEAASYFNPAASMGEERGRSRSRDPPGAEGASRGRALSVDTRSINGDRRRSISRFREEGMVDVGMDSKS